MPLNYKLMNCPHLVTAILNLASLSIFYGNDVVLNDQIDTTISADSISGSVATWTTHVLNSQWTLFAATYDASVNQITSIFFSAFNPDFLSAGWQYPGTSHLGCPKYENEFPVLGSQTMAINPDQMIPNTKLWYDEDQPLDTNPGRADCDSGTNTVRISSGIVSVTPTFGCS